MKTTRGPHAFTLLELIVVVIIITILAVIAVPNFFQYSGPSRVSQALTGSRTLSVALEAYFADHGAYPPSTGILDIQADSDAYGTPPKILGHTFRGAPGLTSPIAYISAYPRDPFGTKGTVLRYYSDGKFWIVGSAGPDKILSLPWEGGIERLYDSSLADPGLPLLTGSGPHGAYTYDPTNGTNSAGDVWRVAVPQPKKVGP